MSKAIEVNHLSKVFSIKESYPGIRGAFKGLFCSKKQEMEAVSDISFSVKRGERLAFIGPNGAGKSTTIKMLTGILYPTSGSISVLGFTPWKERHKLGYKIGTVFGQRTQLWYHLPPSDTFALLSKVYELKKDEYEESLSLLTQKFEVTPYLNKPVRQLSLGQRMRCEIVASLLHKPDILFLDEPTIGLDIDAKLQIRSLLSTLSKEEGTTLFLTSHDTADIEEVCDRVIVLDKGRIITDDSLRNLKRSFIKKKVIRLITDERCLILNLPGLKVLENDNFHFVCEVDGSGARIDEVIQVALKKTTLKDVTIEDPSMEEIIHALYGNGKNAKL